MNKIFKKLNYKAQEEVLVINSPDSFEDILFEMKPSTKIIEKLNGLSEISFCLIFVTKKREIESILKKISDLLIVDAIFWFAYRKGTSKKYKCDFNRDTGWESLGKFGYEAVRMVAIDEDWSALRFKKAEKIKSMTCRKSMALSNEGKRKTKGK